MRLIFRKAPDNKEENVVPASPAAQNMTQAIAKKMGGSGPLNNLVHISEDAGFVYFGSPGACYFRVLGSLNTALAAMNGEQLEYEKLGQVYQRVRGKMANPWETGHEIFDDMLDDPDTLKFTFVRDPVSRFLSGYYGKLTRKTPRSEQRQKMFELLEMDLTQEISVEDFAELVAQDQEVRDLLPLFRPQRNLTAFDLVDFGFIGNHDRWDTDFAKASTHIFGHPVPVFDPQQRFNRDEDGVNTPSQIDAQTQANLEYAYAEDLAMLEEINELFPQS